MKRFLVILGLVGALTAVNVFAQTSSATAPNNGVSASDATLDKCDKHVTEVRESPYKSANCDKLPLAQQAECKAFQKTQPGNVNAIE